MKKIIFLTEEDQQLLQEMFAERRGRVIHGKPAGLAHKYSPASDTYIAYIDPDGIPAVTPPESGSPSAEATPGSALADIYKIVSQIVGTGSPPERTNALVRIGFSELVFNISESLVPNGFTLIHLDRFGRWIAGGQGSQGMVLYRAVITEASGIDANGFGEVQIYQGRPAAPVDDWFETAYNDWLYADEGLAFGDRVIVTRFPGEEDYTILLPWC